MRAEIISDDDALAALAPAWWDLWRRAPETTFFQSPAWLLSWWRSFAPGRLCAVVIRETGELVGMAPFYVESGRERRRLLPLGISVSDYLDVLLDRTCAKAAAQAIVECFAQALDWDTWELEELPPNAAALHLPRPPDSDEAETAHSACPVLILPGRPDDLAAVVPKHKLRNVRQARARAMRRGGVDIARATRDTAADALDMLFALHAKRWREVGQSGVLASPAVQALHRRVIADPCAAELIRLFVVRIAGAPAAVQYGFLHNGRFYAYLIGVDPDYAFESPGTLAVEHAIAEAVREGAREFHFLRGREPYKYSWGATDRWNRHRSFRRCAAAESP